EVADEDPLPNEGDGLGGASFVGPAEGPDAARGRGVGDDVDELAPVAEAGLELVDGEEARPGVARFGAEDPVELRRVAAALVDLEVELRRVEDDRRAPGRALRRRQESDGLVGDGGGVTGEV